MRTRSKRLGGLVAIAAATVLTIGACGSSGGGGSNQQQSSAGFAACEEKPNDCNSGPTKPGGTLTLAMEKKVQNWNSADADGNTLDTQAVMNSILPTPTYAYPNNTFGWNKNLLSEEPK